MARIDINRSGEMEVFVRVIERGGFSAAAREFRMTPSAVSKLVGRLETRLGTRLINRTTRKLLLTPEGAVFHQKALRILADIEEAERSAASAEQPVGRIRINTSASYGTHVLAPILAEFLARYPGISVDLIQTDKVVDLLAERADIAIRAGELASSTLVARKLGETRLMTVASPAYLARMGHPRTIADVNRLNRLGFCYVRASEGWRMMEDGATETISAKSKVQASDGEALRYMAIGGVGMARLAGFSVRADIEAGRLVEILPDRIMSEMEAFHAVYVGQGGQLPARMRVMLDYLAEFGRVS
ncbi:LysR family transcriptional regulator [Rhizobium sp. KVB221]|uniref:HTH-type transcriptional regulator TtuA n=1 Tax=Rhizobium setariae TaxID=2801340 RepID=A0A936YQY8_9HYPH|nr:LysR family transcriptional regulator [Rhizobium setariae]MBL0371191.1 LysR family transcriptional regulator [Rhizobium setariae]